jgi:UDP-N-acetylmuramyl pentapeptide phosphotransferase/UDP-N-acetylglucosamine-1-phosphate transferase
MDVALLLALLVSFATSVVLVPVVGRLAVRIGAVATPRTDRWNRRAVPILGGLAIAGGVIVGSVALGRITPEWGALLAGMAVMVGLGLVDDVGTISPGRRLLVEFITAIVFAWLVTWDLQPPIRLAAIATAAIAMPVAINAVNLVDNADGLAALLSTITAVTLAAIVAAVGIPTEGGTIAIIIGAACLGFLVHNRPPARVFMGDSGSLMIGFGLAGCSVLIVRDAVLTPGSTHAAAAMAVPLAWALQFGDLGMVFITRLRRRASPFQGGVDHTSHRLISAGLGPTRMLLALAFLGAIISAAAVWLAAWVGDFKLVAVAGIGVAILVGVFEGAVAWRLPYVQRPEPGGSSEPAATATTDGPPAAPSTPAATSAARAEADGAVASRTVSIGSGRS